MGRAHRQTGLFKGVDDDGGVRWIGPEMPPLRCRGAAAKLPEQVARVAAGRRHARKGTRFPNAKGYQRQYKAIAVVTHTGRGFKW